MIEMLGVLAIVGVLSVGGFSLVSKMQDNHRVNEVIDNVTSLAYKVRPIARDYREGDSTCTSSKCLTRWAYEGKAYPEGLEYSNYYFTDRNNVKYRIHYNMVGGAGSIESGKALFIIAVTGFTKKMCLQLATTNFGSRSSNGYMGMQIGTGTDSSVLNQLTGQRTLAQAIAECTDENTTIHFGFR
jgi:type II secretory pathway pseudopilin PulG